MAPSWQDSLQAFLDANPGLPEGGEPESATDSKPAPKPRLDIILDRKGRAGKTATIIAGFDNDDSEIKEIASEIKSRLGTGGAARGGEILIQGDRRDDVKRILQEMGYKTRLI
ncbi:MAG: translation initiation factor [Muribaculaceae bacterium]|nr:translation initiation factor [Muribaculaceae bacterium]